MKIPSKSLPQHLKNVLKEYGFNKREIEVKVDNSAKVYGSNHAPEYDNFDYGYAVMVDLNGGVSHDLQSGMKPNEQKSVPLNKNEVLIDGDKHTHYATLTMSQETFDKSFQQTKAASLRAEIAALEKRAASGTNYVEQLEEGIKKIEDALKHLDSHSYAVTKMKEDLKHLNQDHDKFMTELMDQVEPLP